MRIVSLVATVVVAGCLDANLAGRRCGDGHPCIGNYECVEGRCFLPSSIVDGGSQVVDDGGRATDAGVVIEDAGAADGGVIHDAGVEDAGAVVDGGFGPDGGDVVDGGATTDAGSATDAGPVQDAGTPMDAGGASDAGPAVDAGAGPVLTDSFDGTGGWDDALWAQDQNVFTISNNEGRISVTDQDVGSAGAIAQHAPIDDVDVVFSFRFGDTSSSLRLRAYLRGSGNWGVGGRPTSGYQLELRNDDGTARIEPVVGGTLGTDLATGLVWANPEDTDKHWVRFQAIGSSIRWRTWDDGANEPATWDVDVPNTSIASAGVFQLRA